MPNRFTNATPTPRAASSFISSNEPVSSTTVRARLWPATSGRISQWIESSGLGRTSG